MDNHTLSPAALELEDSLGLKHSLSLKDQGEAVVFLVHGRAGRVSDISIFKNSVPKSWNIICPQAKLVDPHGSFSWWVVDEYRDYTEDIDAAARELKDFIESSIQVYALEGPVYALGFSQGAALLAVILQKYPQLFSGLALLSGFVPQVEVAPGTKFPDVFIAHGTEDQVVSISKAKAGAIYLEGLGANVKMLSDQVGHKVGRLGMRELKEWFQHLVKNQS